MLRPRGVLALGLVLERERETRALGSLAGVAGVAGRVQEIDRERIYEQ